MKNYHININLLKHILISLFFLIMFFCGNLSATENAKAISVNNVKDTDTGTNERPWWLGDLITIFGIFIATGGVIYQLKRQHKNELELQKENFREQLRLEIYQEFSKVQELAMKKGINAGTSAGCIPISLKLFRSQIKLGSNPIPIKERAETMRNIHSEAQEVIRKIIRLLEKYEIINPELNIFKLAIGVAIHDVLETFDPFHLYLLKLLPMEIVDDNGVVQVANVITPTEEQLGKLECLVGKYKDAQDDLTMYLHDLNVELQNIFLSKLFNNKVPKRQPLDPSCKVITTEPEEVKKLTKYFKEETSWGKQSMKTEESVIAKLQSSKLDV